MAATERSQCPISLSLEVFGDRWTLLVLRDIVFADKRHYGALAASEEGVSTTVLADRLQMLVDQGLLTKADDPGHRQRALYSLTEASIALVPALVQIGAWGRRFRPASDELSVYADVLSRGGPRMWESFMDDLRERHLGAAARHRPAGSGPSFARAVRRAVSSSN